MHGIEKKLWSSISWLFRQQIAACLSGFRSIACHSSSRQALTLPTLDALDWLRSYLVDRIQFVKMGQHQTRLSTGSVLGPLLFAVYCSPVGDIICRHTRSVPYPHHHTSTITPDLANLHVNSIHPPCHYFTDLLREHMSPTALTDVVCLLKL